MQAAQRSQRSRREDDFFYSFRMKLRGGGYLDLTGWNGTATVTDKKTGDLIVTATVTIDPVQADDTLGKVDVAFNWSDVDLDADFDVPDSCYWRIRLTNTIPQTQTYIEGDFSFYG